MLVGMLVDFLEHAEMVGSCFCYCLVKLDIKPTWKVDLQTKFNQNSQIFAGVCLESVVS